jgi:hypothetical protein
MQCYIFFVTNSETSGVQSMFATLRSYNVKQRKFQVKLWLTRKCLLFVRFVQNQAMHNANIISDVFVQSLPT